MATFYLCNGEVPYCKGSVGCYRHGGECKHTTHPEYSLYSECPDPWKHPERFEPEVIPGYDTYYFERKKDEDGNEANV